VSDDPLMRYVDVLKSQLAEAKRESDEGWRMFHNLESKVKQQDDLLKFYRKMTGVTIKIYDEDEDDE